MQSPELVRFWKDPDHVPYHLRQFAEPYRSTVYLNRFLQSLGLTGGNALDVCCGAGANIYHLSQWQPAFSWTGIDLAGDVLFHLGEPFFRSRDLRPTLLQGDLYEMDSVLQGRKFDLVLCLQTALVLPDFFTALERLLDVTRGWLVISSLFTDFDVNVRTDAFDLARPSGCQGPFSYHVYSVSRVRAFCESHGSL
jgi:SAM-dependent methyltransferase